MYSGVFSVFNIGGCLPDIIITNFCSYIVPYKILVLVCLQGVEGSIMMSIFNASLL